MTMQIIRWNPMREVAHMHDEIMRDWLRQGRAARPGAWAPPMDAIDGDGMLTLSLDLPGVGIEDVQIEAHEGMLHIRGERARPTADGAWQRVERSFGPFARTLRLPDDAEAASITATMDRGVLTVTIPRTQRPQPHRIPVSEGGGATDVIDGDA